MEGLQPLVVLLLFAAIGVLVVQSLRLARQRQIASAYQAAAAREYRRHVAHHERSARAVAGESSAQTLLARAGYRVLEHQVAGSWMVHADGRPQTFDLRGDYLVAREGRCYVAEVKTGQQATRLSHAATRRQLLEYRAAFDVDGVLLVDADQETITHVEFEQADRLASNAGTSSTALAPGGRARTLALLVAFAAGLLVGAALALHSW